MLESTFTLVDQQCTFVKVQLLSGYPGVSARNANQELDIFCGMLLDLKWSTGFGSTPLFPSFRGHFFFASISRPFRRSWSTAFIFMLGMSSFEDTVSSTQ